MNAVFFAVRNHHLKYFSQLARHANHHGHYQATVLRHKQAWKRGRGFLTHPGLSEIVSLKLKELTQNTGDYKLSRWDSLVQPVWMTYWSRFLFSAYRQALLNENPDCLITWSGMMWHQRIMATAANTLGIPVIFMENGPLPATTTVDAKGVNFNNSLPRELSFYQRIDITEQQALPDGLIPRAPHKNKRAEVGEQPSLPDSYVFVPFQVDADRQILCFSPWISNMRVFYSILESALDSLPSSMSIVVKEHPSCPKNFSDLHTKNPRICFANSHNTQSLIENSVAVATINSSVGLEAMLLNKPVIVLGDTFYNIKGLVQSATSLEQLKQLFTEVRELKPSNHTKHYLGYLYHQYLIKGSWKEANEQHVDAMNRRIMELLH